MSKLKHFKRGVIEELPLQVGVFPFGIIYGMMATEHGLSLMQAFFMSSIIFAGASQIAFAKLYLVVSPIMLLTSVTAINLRHFLYGVSINEYLNHFFANFFASGLVELKPTKPPVRFGFFNILLVAFK